MDVVPSAIVTQEDREFFDLFAERDEDDFSDSFLDHLQDERDSLIDHKAAKYLVDFRNTSKEEGMLLSGVSKDVLQDTRKIRDEYEDERERAQRRYFKLLKEAKPTAKKSYIKFYQKSEKKKKDFFRQRSKRHKELMSNLRQTFRTGEKYMKKKLRTRKKLVRKHYGNLQTHSQSLSAHRQFAECKEVLSVELKFLNGIREKLPPGDYIIMMSLREKIDGGIVKGTEIQVSEFIHLSGRFDDHRSELMCQRFLPIPARKFRTPYLCIQFSLIQIRGSFPGLSVGWGVFPLQDYQFDVNYGYYKVPLLRGWREETTFKFSQIHKVLRKKLNNWLGNLYIELRSDEKYFRGVVENEFKMERLKNEVDLYFISQNSSEKEREDLEMMYDLEDYIPDENEDESGLGFSSGIGSKDDEALFGWAGDSRTRARRRLARKRKAKRELERDQEGDEIRIDYSRDDDEEEVEEEGEDENDGRTRGNRLMEGRPGEDEEEDVVERIDPNDPEYLANNSNYSLQKPFGYKESIVKKGKYLSIIILNDMGLRINRISVLFSLAFLSTIFLFIFSWFIRLYSYYFFQFVFMKWLVGLDSDVKYYPSVLWVDLEYQYVDQVSPILEFFNLVVGNLGNVGLLVFGIGMIWVSQSCIGTTLPLFAHKFVVCFGVNVGLNSLYNMFFDCCRQNWKHADLLKVYYIYAETDSEFLGILLVVMMFCWFFLLVFILLYYFLLHIFMNGQIIDIYRRINGKEINFFIPQDNEISLEELYYVCEKSKKYRGKNGEVRTTLIWEYAEKDPNLKNFKSYFVHIVILTVPTNKKYREFLYSSKSKSIVEVYEGQLNSFLKNMKSQDMEKVLL